MSEKAGCKIIEGRLADDTDFFEIDVLCATIDEAKQEAQNYLLNHHLRDATITWKEGDSNTEGPVWYGQNRRITFRIRQ